MGFSLFALIELLLFSINSTIDFKNKKYRNIAALMMFLFMLIFAGIRGSGDADYYNYLWFVKDIDKDLSKLFEFTYPVEFAFRFFALVVNFLGLSRQWVIVIMNLFSIIPITYISIKESEDPFLAAIIFLPIFIQFDMQTSRTASSIGLGLLSVYMRIKSKKIKSILAFLCSVAFHKAGFIVLPFLFLINFNIGKTFKLITVGIAFVISIFSLYVFRLISMIVGTMGLSVISRKIDTYVFSGGLFAFPMKIYDPRILFMLLLFAFSILYFKDHRFNKNSMQEVSIKAMYFGLIVFLVFRSSTAVAFRFGNFFSIYQIFFIPLILKESRYIKDRLGYFIICLSIVFFIIPYAGFLMNKAPAYDFFFTNKNAIHSLRR